MRLPAVFALLVCFVTCLAARADTYQYDFQFTHLSNGDADFSLAIDEPAMLTATGLATLPAAAQTSLGYTVQNFGTNDLGEFLFSHQGGIIADTYIAFSTTSFVFLPNDASSYLALGSYTGSMTGNIGLADFSGNGVLTIRDLQVPASVTPEPSGFVLLGTGLLGAAAMLRRRFV